ncbi:MAG: hypothetical protein ACD_62C00402G0004 [uncultured bacterium]|nr:MAG: hypothetical protein ACD_62C00402G0004 [uncultured bacterium]
MHKEYHKWFSPHLGQDMELNVYGHGGIPFVVFPSSSGRFYNYEDFGMVHALEEFINEGKLKLFTVDGIDGQTWYNYAALPGDRSARHDAYDRHILAEVVPFIKTHCQDNDIGIYTTGCSLGAYHAVNFFLKHPDVFNGTIAQSGLYRLDRFQFKIEAHDIPYVYFNSPIHYLANLEDEKILANMRKSKVIVSVGQGAWEHEMVEDTRLLQEIFYRKNIRATFDYWGYDVNHDWPWWRKQIHHFMPGFL